MEYNYGDIFLKFKEYDDYSLKDLANQTASFGLYRSFQDQKELIGIIDSSYLCNKYKDDSINDNNAINVLKNHIKDNYLLFSFASFQPMNQKRVMYLWKRYTHNNGYAALYSYKDIMSFIANNNEEGIYRFKKIEYIVDELDLTGYFDCFLESVDEDSFNFDKFYSLLRLTGHGDDEIKYMCSKTKYEHEIECEYRLIKAVKNDVIIKNHCLIKFIKPLKVYILKSSNNELIKKTISICILHNIPFELVDNKMLLKY